MRPYLFLVLVLAVYWPALAQQTLQDGSGLTAYRPQHSTGYFPFARTAVPEVFEEHHSLGPGIRVNGAGEVDPEGEDDLIEVIVGHPSANATFVLERSDPRLSVWSTREKRDQTEISFVNARSTRLAFGNARQITLWVEWTGNAPAYPALSLLALESDDVVDRIVFHAFQGLVVALGGESQKPDPVNMNEGTFRVATALYKLGWDVLMRDENEVYGSRFAPDPVGSGPVYDEVVNAIQNRSVQELAVFGYSHGGGSTFDLCALLDRHRRAIGTFSVSFTAYIDGIRNSSDWSIRAERRPPPASEFHANFYQQGAVPWRDWPHGGPMVSPQPPPSGLNIETVVWGLNIETVDWGEYATHYNIDDLAPVRDLILSELTAQVGR